MPLLRECVARGHSLFDQVLAAALAGGFSIPVAAAQVHPRVESAILYPCPLLAGVPGAESAFNRLQGAWARKLLGCHGGPPLRQSVLVAQCGWPLRLGSRFIERALMARARFDALPAGHPASIAGGAAATLPVRSWLTDAAALALVLPSPLCLPITVHPGFAGAPLHAARSCPAARRALLQACKWQVLRPAVLDYDRAAFQEAATPPLPTLGFSFAAVCPAPAWPLLDLLQIERGPALWTDLRAWAVTRMSGAWPLPVFGGRELPYAVPSCPWCGALQASVRHALVECPGTVDAFNALRQSAAVPPREAPDFFLRCIFAEGAAVVDRAAHLTYVGSIVRPACVRVVLESGQFQPAGGGGTRAD